MKFISIITLFFPVVLLTQAQDSTTIIKQQYQRNINEGRVINNIGTGLIAAGVVTTILVFPYAAFEPDAQTIVEAAVITTLIAIPIALIGKHIQRSNEKKLVLYTRL